jgi:hypothetical protein
LRNIALFLFSESDLFQEWVVCVKPALTGAARQRARRAERARRSAVFWPVFASIARGTLNHGARIAALGPAAAARGARIAVQLLRIAAQLLRSTGRGRYAISL